MVSRNLVDLGNLVGAGESTLLTTVRRIDPIFAYFEVSERFMAQVLEQRGGHKEPETGGSAGDLWCSRRPASRSKARSTR